MEGGVDIASIEYASLFCIPMFLMIEVNFLYI